MISLDEAGLGMRFRSFKVAELFSLWCTLSLVYGC
jgi:hypothetical protein